MGYTSKRSESVPQTVSSNSLEYGVWPEAIQAVTYSVCRQHPSVYMGGWRNQMCARVGAMIGLYSPKQAIPKVRHSGPYGRYR